MSVAGPSGTQSQPSPAPVRAIVLDSTPLGLIVRRPDDGGPADQCRDWAERKARAGHRLYVPAIIDYELRRELLRLGKAWSIRELDAYATAVPGRYLPLTDADLRLAAELWADARRAGKPTADPAALDIDVILAAQARSLGLPDAAYVVATANVGHLARYAPADPWAAV